MRCDEVDGAAPGAGRRRRPRRLRGRAPRRDLPALPGRAGPVPPAAAGPRDCCGPGTSSPRPGCSARPWPRSPRRPSAGARRTLLSGPAPRVRRRDRRQRSPPRRPRRLLDRPVPPAGASASPDGRRRRRPESAGSGPLGEPAAPGYRFARPGLRQGPEGSSSIGRAPVSKTGGWGFESLLPCSICRLPPSADSQYTTARRHEPTDQATDGASQGADKPRAPEQPRLAERAGRARRTARRSTSREVRGEMKKVAWPTEPEVMNSTIIVLDRPSS